MNARLAALALRRALHPSIAGAAILLAWLAARGAHAPGWLELGSVSGGSTRAQVWSALALLLLPALSFVALRAPARWREGERLWLAARAGGAWTGPISTWVGSCAGGALLLLAPLLAGELAAGGGSASFRAAGELAAPSARSTRDGQGLAWEVPDPGRAAPPGSRARLDVEVRAGAGRAVDAVLHARRAGGGATAARARLARAGTLEVELPPGPGALELELERVGEGASLALVRPAAVLLVPVGSSRTAGLVLCLHLLLALAAAVGLGLGLGAWLEAGTAAVLLGSAWLAALLGPAEPWAATPGAGFVAALASAGEDLVPALPSWTALGGGLAASLAGIALARAAAGWRGER